MDQNKIPWIVTFLGIQLFLLFLANVWNAWIIIHSAASSNLFHVSNFIWPVANAFLFVTAIIIFKVNGIAGWKKYLPLLVALLLHAAFFLLYLYSGRNNATMLIGGVYSIIAWMLLGYVAITPSASTKSLKEKYESNSKYMLAIN